MTAASMACFSSGVRGYLAQSERKVRLVAIATPETVSICDYDGSYRWSS